MYKLMARTHNAGLSSLTYLQLANNEITSLPDGPYLDRLECLSLEDNKFSNIPQVHACSVNGGGRAGPHLSPGVGC